MVQLVLLERVSKLGSMGDIVNVKPGYARNYLLPQKKALRASEENIKMWMKNTLIPLDIIFISKDKEIVELKHNMKELSHSVITSKIKSKYALEINAGLINKLNIEIGDRVYFNE